MPLLFFHKHVSSFPSQQLKPRCQDSRWSCPTSGSGGLLLFCSFLPAVAVAVVFFPFQYCASF